MEIIEVTSSTGLGIGTSSSITKIIIKTSMVRIRVMAMTNSISKILTINKISNKTMVKGPISSSLVRL